MLYHSIGSCWTVCQKKSLKYYYTTTNHIHLTPNDRADKIATSLRPIGPTLLVEWEE